MCVALKVRLRELVERQVRPRKRVLRDVADVAVDGTVPNQAELISPEPGTDLFKPAVRVGGKVIAHLAGKVGIAQVTSSLVMGVGREIDLPRRYIRLTMLKGHENALFAG